MILYGFLGSLPRLEIGGMDLLQGNDRVRRPSSTPSSVGPTAAADDELAAWNRYVQRLETDGQPDTGRRS